MFKYEHIGWGNLKTFFGKKQVLMSPIVCKYIPDKQMEGNTIQLKSAKTLLFEFRVWIGFLFRVWLKVSKPQKNFFLH